jgi:hypothetical protein
MGYRLQGLAHAQLLHLTDRVRRSLAAETGQGTVEYVALILLVAGVFTAVVAAGKGKNFDLHTSIVNKLKDSIEEVGGKK